MIKKKSDDATIFIGDKPFMNYVTAAMLQFNSGNKEIFMKARGKHISRAVDVTEVLRNRFMNDVKVNNIEIGSEDVKSREGREMKVSTIKISLTK
ncbi:MAG: DNA-binding protein Alba [Nanoarchaeota archaeon]|nr:DNA-binding protein Alba [Nanoarchaeota archaeon]